jgi:hypothetical protein
MKKKERRKGKGKMTKLMNTKVVFLQRFQCTRTRDSEDGGRGGGEHISIFPGSCIPVRVFKKKK